MARPLTAPSARLVAGLWLLSPLLSSIAGCQPAPTVQISTLRGVAMGTSYTIKYVPVDTELPVGTGPTVETRVTQELRRFAGLFSTYDAESEISRFNRHRSTDPFAASPEFAAVVRRALELAQRTEGAFDPTLGPLLRLYGFGPGGKPPAQPPSAEDLATARAKTGWTRLRVSAAGALSKEVPELELDLNAFAKGTGVDRVAQALRGMGIESYMVEIGGEVRCRGRKPNGAVWRLGVAHPKGVPSDLADQVDLLDRAMATSGSYLQFREIGKRRVHHILDPSTGANPEGRLVSVTVIADTCELADGLATALMVLGPDAGEKVLQGFAGDDVKVLFLLRKGDDIERRTYRW